MGNPKRFSTEAAFDLLLAVCGAAVMIVSLSYGFGTFRRPGPGLFPFFIGLFVLLFSVPLLPAALRSPARPVLLAGGRVKIFLLMVAGFCLWILLMPFLGYIAVTLLATGGFCKVMGLEGWRKPVLLSLGTGLFIYLLFDYWLYIDLPRGILG
jgi:putative tricarboxylic transport membrane protein